MMWMPTKRNADRKGSTESNRALPNLQTHRVNFLRSGEKDIHAFAENRSRRKRTAQIPLLPSNPKGRDCSEPRDGLNSTK